MPLFLTAAGDNLPFIFSDDTGPGIPPEMLPRIFEPFVTSKEERCTGIGLWVTAEIITLCLYAGHA